MDGLPSWLDTTLYLSAPETRELLPAVFYNGDGRCLICNRFPSGPTFALEAAHIARKQMGGRKKDGPKCRICPECHTGRDGIDRTGDKTLAIRRSDTTPVYLTWDGEITEHDLHWGE